MFKIGDEVVLTETAKEQCVKDIKNSPVDKWNNIFLQMVYANDSSIIHSIDNVEVWLDKGNFWVGVSDVELVKDSVDFIPHEVVALGEELAPVQHDFVNHPKHYAFFQDVEAIEIIASSMTVEMYKGYCMGNSLKYRLRAGNKDKLEQDIAKADKYKELFEKHKHLCKE